jgi:hypothetical protein
MTLADVQSLFWRSMRFDPAPPEVDSAFLSRGTLGGRERMAIYRNMYWFRQVDALWDTFSVLASVMGERDFTQMACRYITAYPSEKPALEWLGRHMVAHLNAEKAAPIGLEVAALEWAHLEAIVASNPKTHAQLSDIQAETFATATLRFDPSLRHVEADPRVLTLWDRYAFSTRREVDPLAANELGLATRKAGFAVWRPMHASKHLQLEPDESQALLLALGGAPMEQVCSSFLRETEDQEANAASTQRAFSVIRGWFERHWIEEVVP